MKSKTQNIAFVISSPTTAAGFGIAEKRVQEIDKKISAFITDKIRDGGNVTEGELIEFIVTNLDTDNEIAYYMFALGRKVDSINPR